MTLFVLKHTETGEYATSHGRSADLQQARAFTRRSTAHQCRHQYTYVDGVRWNDPTYHDRFETEKLKWVAVEVFLTEATNATPAPTPPPPPPSEPEDPLEAAGLIFKPGG